MLAQLLTATALASAPLVLAQSPSQFLYFNMTVPATSGMVTKTGRWETYLDGNGSPAAKANFNPRKPGDISIVGAGGATTASPNLSGLTFNFAGTAIYIDGTVANSRDVYLMTSGNPSRVDNWTNNSKIEGSIATMGAQSINVNAYGTLNISTKATTAVTWNVNNVTFTTGLLTDAPSFADVPSTVENFFVGSVLNPKFTWRDGGGTWSVAADLVDPKLTSVTGRAPQTAAAPAVLIPIPRNTSFFTVKGLSGPSDSIVRLEIQNRPPWTPQYLQSNCGNPVRLYNQPLFFSPLDPTVETSISIEIVQPGSLVANASIDSRVSLQSITFYSGLWDGPKRNATDGSSNSTITQSTTPDTNQSVADNASGKKKTPIGAIVGGVVGGVVVLLALLFVTWYLATKRVQGNRKQMLQDKETFAVDDTVVAPFSPPPGSGYSGNQLGSGGTYAPVASSASRSSTSKSRPIRTATEDEPPVHATDSAQLPPIYDPRWRDIGESSGSASASGSGPSSGPVTATPYEDLKRPLMSDEPRYLK